MVKCKDCGNYPSNCWDWDKNIRKDDRIAHKTKDEDHDCEDFTQKIKTKTNYKHTWDCNKDIFIETPKEMLEFFKDIEEVCKKHGLSISHEDGHGGFLIEKYDEHNIKWLRSADKAY